VQWYDAIILGIVEGITEYLPISSTGHLIIFAALLGLDEPERTKNAVDAFNIVIQGGAILAVLGLYRRRVADMVRGLLGRDPVGRKLAINLIIAFLPAALTGPLLSEWIEAYLFYPGPVIAALAIGGVVMILLRKWQRSFFHPPEDDDSIDAHTFVDIEHLTWRRALLIGLFQCVAMWPGTSRSMVTIVGGMITGMRAKHAAEFSFLLGLPTLGGACVYRGAKSFMSDEASMFEVLGGPMPVILGFIVAMISAALAIKWLVRYLERHSLAAFGWYRIILAIIVAILAMRGFLNISPNAAEQTHSPSARVHVTHNP